ncbi:MAG: DUF362 domain-containing protein [Clostridia bacterium]|nr:DUF362 domain-containing protein [Clostridia bacterium]
MAEASIVALVPVSTYDQSEVDRAVHTGMRLLGGIGQFVRPEEKILLKPNLLTHAVPQKAITTHPAVLSAVVKLLQEEGCHHLSYGDSPGSPTTNPKKVAAVSGLDEAAQALNIPLGDFDHGRTVSFPEGRSARSFCLCNAVTDCDALINLCKMKTHALERITGAVKNMYGCILGVNKAAGHARHPSSETFADMLCDLHRCVRPRLHIMDGITAMEGNGPSSGTPTAMNVLLFSADAVALDSVFSALVALDPATVPTCTMGQEQGIGVYDWDKITVRTPEGDLSVQEAAAKYGKPEFDVYRGEMKKHLLSKLMPLLPFLQDRPKADMKKCVACGICEEACPVEGKAVHSGKGKKAVYDYKKCIRCYCCQEMCPAKAIEVYHHPLKKLFE